MVVGGYRVGPLLKQTRREIGADGVTTLAASGAYNFFFSLFPLLLFLAPLLSLVGNKQKMVSFVMGQLVAVLPPTQLAAIRPILDDVVFSPGAPGLISVGLLLAAWSGSNIFGTLISALNTAYDVEETRAWWKQQAIRLLALVVGGLIVLLSTVVILNGEGIANWIGNLLRLGPAFVLAWKIIQYPLALAFLVLFAFLTFYMLPNVR